MFLGDKGKPTKYPTIRKNFYLIIDDERMTVRKLITKLGFWTVIPDGKMNEREIVYDTDKKLLTGVGLILRKKITPNRSYFSLVRVNNLNTSLQLREKKSFLGECEANDQPSDFPTQIANEINNIFNNLFTINLVDIVKHSSPYINIEIRGNRYKIVSGTGYEVTASFEDLRIKDERTGRKGKKRIFSIKMEDDPNYEMEREHLEGIISRYCKELAPVVKNRFEIAETVVKTEEVDQAELKRKKKEEKAKKKQEEERKRREEEEY